MERLQLVALHPVAALCGVCTVTESRQTELMVNENPFRMKWLSIPVHDITGCVHDL